MTLSGVDPSAHDLFIGTFFKPALGLWTYVWQLPSSPSDTFSIYPFSFSTCMCVWCTCNYYPYSYVCECVHVCGDQGCAQCLPRSLSTLFTDAGPLDEDGKLIPGILVTQVVLGISCLCLPSVGDGGSCHTYPFSVEFWTVVLSPYWVIFLAPLAGSLVAHTGPTKSQGQGHSLNS